MLRLTKEKVEQGISQDRLTLISTDEKDHLILPKDQGYYMFILRTKEENNIQVYTGMLFIN